MENYLFYAYLKYNKENRTPFIEGFFKLPIKIIFAFSVAVISSIAFIISGACKENVITIISFIVNCLFSLILYFLVENYQIKFSDENYEDYKNQCRHFKEWLLSYNITSKEMVEELHIRVENDLKKDRELKKYNSEKNFKYVQTLIIPIIVAAFTAYATKASIYNLIAIVIEISIIFAFLYSLFLMIKSIISFPSKKRLQEKECFSNLLQGAIDFWGEE